MTSFQVGIGVRDITPPDAWIRAGRIWLWGYGSRSEPCEGVHDSITARALCIRDAADNAVVLATVDIGALDPLMTEAIRTRVSGSQGVPRENICINVTHTHGAPVPVAIPTWQPGFALPDAEYLQFLEDRITLSIEEACRATEAATLQFARGTTAIGYDRHFGAPGLHDPTLDVLKITDENEDIIALVCFTACHPVCLGDFNKVYADFPGVARHLLEQRFGGTALFVQGYCGISNPIKRDPEAIGSAFADDVITVVNGPTDELTGPLHTSSSAIRLPFQPLPDTQVRERARSAGGIYARWAEAMEALGDRVPDSLPAQLQAFRLGSGTGAWVLAASSHEVTADLAARVRFLLPQDHVTPIGFSNSQLSYVPSRRVLTLPDGYNDFPFCENYEGGVAFAWYGHRAPLTPDVDEQFVEAHAALFDHVHR